MTYFTAPRQSVTVVPSSASQW